MNYCNAYAYVEGETEEDFVKNVLNPYYEQDKIYLTPINFKGTIKYNQFIKDIQKLLSQSHIRFVTTMIDIYGIHSSFLEGYNRDYQNGKTNYVVQRLSTAINSVRFIPYIQTHEFEAILFADKNKLINYLKYNYDSNTAIIQNEVRNPENINFNTPPSQIILNTEPSYSKVIDGVIISRKIGISTIREKCPLFDNWLSTIENFCK